KVSFPGRAFACAVSSDTDATGSEGCTTSRLESRVSIVTGAKSRTGSYGSFAYRFGLTEKLALAANNSVYPSGAALAASSAAMLPPAPARLSITICCPNRSVSFCATGRMMRSDAPPGGNGMISRIGLAGYCCATACMLHAASAPARKTRNQAAFAFMGRSVRRRTRSLDDRRPLRHIPLHNFCKFLGTRGVGNRPLLEKQVANIRSIDDPGDI